VDDINANFCSIEIEMSSVINFESFETLTTVQNYGISCGAVQVSCTSRGDTP